MAEKKTTGDQEQDKKVDAPTDDVSEVTDQVQEAVDGETERGYRGTGVDPTPNDNYTVAGVTSGAPTPETDPKAAEKIAGQATTKFNNK